MNRYFEDRHLGRPPTHDHLTVVFCENYLQFEHYCRENNISRNNRNVIFASDSHSIRGLQGFETIYYGTPERRRDYREMRDMLHLRSRYLTTEGYHYDYYYYYNDNHKFKRIDIPNVKLPEEKSNKRPVWF